MSDTIEPVEHPRNYEIPGWSNADAINARNAIIAQADAEIERLRAEIDRLRAALAKVEAERDELTAAAIRALGEQHD